MESSPAQSLPVHLVAEVDRAPDGRLQGRMRPEAADSWTPFSGVLELLKTLEQLCAASPDEPQDD